MNAAADTNTATRPGLTVDANEVERALRKLVPAGGTFEVRAIHVERGFEAIHSGYFVDPSLAAKYVARRDSRSYVGWYVTLNPVDPSLRARRADRVEKVGKDSTTKDHHVPAQLRLLIDVDAVRPTGISSSDEEHAAALQLASEIAHELHGLGWPDSFTADSGNGAHLVFAIDEDCGDLVEPFLKAADRRWSCDIDGLGLKIDTAVHNPSRITKLYGTPARKGDDIRERPHRLSRLLSAPAELAPVTRAMLEAFIAENHEEEDEKVSGPETAGSENSESKPNGGKIDAPSWLEKYGYTVITTAPYAGRKGSGTLYELSSCPYNSEHGDRGEAHVIQFDSGAVVAGCHHSTCKAAGWGWKWLREKHEPKKTKRGDGAVKIATGYVAKHATHPDGITLRRWRGDFYRWDARHGHYVALTGEQLRADLYRKLGLGKRSDVGEVEAALIAVNDVLQDHVELGSWLDGDHEHDPLDVAACQNGILHLPTRTLIPSTPRYFASTALGASYDRHAAKPTLWQSFLEQLWPDDPDSIALLQEWFGYLLTRDTRQQKILLLLGRKRSGKGTIGRVLGALLGAPSVASPTLASLGQNFGLSPLIGKTAAIIGDARLGGRNDIAQVVERLLSISGEDLQTVDRKYRDLWTGHLATRITILSNEPPKLTDASDALASRMLALDIEPSFYGREDYMLTSKLVAELPGILSWAIEGWARLRDRGRFVQPAASEGVIGDMIDLGSPIAAWARAVCRTDEEDKLWWLTAADGYESFKTWCQRNGVQHVPTMTTFGRDLKTATGCQLVQVSRGDKTIRAYRGLALR